MSKATRIAFGFRPIEHMEDRVLLSAGGTPDPGFGNNGIVSGYTAYAR